MAETIEELLVKAKPEGIDETSDQLDGLEEDFRETAEGTGDVADQMTDLAVEWQGAMTAILGGLLVASAGLLSQVPILGELMDGLVAIIEAVAFQMDQVLRPVLQPVGDLFFWIAEQIFEADGIMGDFVGVVGALVGVVVPLAIGMAKVAATFIKGATTFGLLKRAAVLVFGALKSIVSVIAGFVSGSLAAAAAVGALIGLLVVGILEVTGIIDAIINFGAALANKLPGFVTDAITALIAIFAGGLAVIGGFIVGFVRGFLEGGLVNGLQRGVDTAKRVFDVLLQAIKGFAGDIHTALGDVADSIVDTLNEIVTEAFRAGKAVTEEFAKGLKSNAGAVADAAGDIAGTVRQYMPSSPADKGPLSDLDKTGPGLVEEFAGGIEANVGRVSEASQAAASAAQTEGDGGESFRGRGGTPPIQVLLDGREVSRGQRRYEDSPVNRRGRFG